MNDLNKVVPGKVEIEGIVSGENLQQNVQQFSSAAHFPSFASTTPRGRIYRQNVDLSNFSKSYGKTADPFTPYYNPITYGISLLAKSGQSTIDFCRLTNNTENARAIFGIIVYENVTIPKYKRTAAGDYVLNSDNEPVKEGTGTGIYFTPAYYDLSGVKNKPAIGSVGILDVTAPEGSTSVPAGTKGKFYPFAEGVSGVGSDYNNMYMSIGQSGNIDWSELARFVLTNGSYPFVMHIGERQDNGLRTETPTINGSMESTFTLVDTQIANGLSYSLGKALGNFTNTNINRPVDPIDGPFEDIKTYPNNISTVLNIFYQAEYGQGKQPAPQVRTKRLPNYAIMNPIDGRDHFGKPYYNIVSTGLMGKINSLVTTKFTLNHYIPASGGIDPFADKDGKFPSAPSDWLVEVDGTWVTGVSSPAIPTKKQYWEMNQQLLANYLRKYINGKEFRDVIRNRTSFFWDLGFKQEVKDIMTTITGLRKDVIVVHCATEWLRKRSIEEIYSTGTMLSIAAAAIPESESYSAPACRTSVNLWDARYIDEPTFERFSLNIDTMCAFAAAGGGADGRMFKSKMPDSDSNANLRYAFDPLVGFEDDDPAAQNLINGCITVRPVNFKQWKRPALPTVYPDSNSVLKDLPNPWLGVCIEKALQDEWIIWSGDRGKTALEYLEGVRANTIRRINNTIGSNITSLIVQTEFRDKDPNNRSLMYAKVIFYVGKARYMLNAVLEARNEQDLDQ